MTEAIKDRERERETDVEGGGDRENVYNEEFDIAIITYLQQIETWSLMTKHGHTQYYK